jgi:hypothetical protein
VLNRTLVGRFSLVEVCAPLLALCTLTLPAPLARACSCGSISAQLESPPAGAHVPLGFPIIVAVDADPSVSFRIEDPNGAPVSFTTEPSLRALGLCSVPKLIVHPATPWPPGGPYRVVPVFFDPTRPSTSDEAPQVFFIDELPAPSVAITLGVSASVITHATRTPSGNVCADNQVDGRPFTRTSEVIVTMRPPVDLIVTTSVADPLRGRLANAFLNPFFAWSQYPSRAEDGITIDLPLFGDVSDCATVEVRDLGGATLFADQLCPGSNGTPPPRTVRAQVAAIPPELAGRGCQVADTTDQPSGTVVGLSLCALALGHARRRRRCVDTRPSPPR